MTDNPYEPSSSVLADEPNEGDTLAPVDIEPWAILGRCWELFQRNPGTVLGAVLIPIIPSFLITGVQQGASFAAPIVEAWADDSGNEGLGNVIVIGLAMLQLALAIVSWAVSIYFQLGTVRIYTRLARGLPADLMLLFGELVRVPSAMVASLVFAFAVVFGLLLLVVPGIIAVLGLQLFLYALVDQDLGPVEALKESWRLTDGHKLALLIVNIVMTILAIAVTCLTCCIGYLAVLPILSLAQSVIYHALLNLRGSREGDS